MRIFEFIGLGVLAVVVVLLAIFVRRGLISRAGGTIEMNMRLSTLVPGRGWAPGIGRFVGSQLRWYRMFSFGVRPRRVLDRQGLVVQSKRPPEGPERLALPPGWLVVRCCAAKGTEPVELAMAASALNGFLSWLEAAPPGALRRMI